jgi:hypothetical protein
MKPLYILSWLVIVSMIGLILLFGFWLLYPYNPVEFKDEVYPVLNENKTVKQGDILKYEVDYCKRVDQVPVVNKKYVDGIIYETPMGRGVVFKGCRAQVVDNIVPENLLPGEYFMQIEIDYEMNPIRHIIYHNRTEKFTVTE